MSKKTKKAGGTFEAMNKYNPEEWPKEEEAKRRTWLDAMYTQQVLQHRTSILENENLRLRGNNDDIRTTYDKSKKSNHDRIYELDSQIKHLERKYEDLRESKRNVDAQFAKYHEDTTEEIKQINDKSKQEKDSDSRKIKELEKQLQDAEIFKSQKQDYVTRIAQLEKDLDKEKKDKTFQLGEKERDKIQATEMLRKEMLVKIKETKANLLALNDEQLQTTTRLTILQNHQLTTELEYQSKQTEQLLQKNSQMQSKIEVLNREITIHKEVEKELAKRSHFCQKVIKRLKGQVKDLESSRVEKLGRYESTNRQRQVYTSGTGSGIGNGRRMGHTVSKSLLPSQEFTSNQQQSDDLINFLEHKLQEIENKLSSTQVEYEQLKRDYLQLHDKTQNNKEKYQRAALLLTEFLDDLLKKQPNILQTDKDIHLNLDKLKEEDFDHLSKEDKVALVLVLLKQLQPYLSTQNLATTPATAPSAFSPRSIGSAGVNGQLNFHNSLAGSKMSSSRAALQTQRGGLINVMTDTTSAGSKEMFSPRQVQKNNFIQGKADDILREHGANGTQADVDALHSILNNVNVQHQGLRGSVQPKRQLPPI